MARSLRRVLVPGSRPVLPAAHAHPYRGRGLTGGTATPPSSDEPAVRGNRQSQIYHLPNCPGYARLGPASAVTFASEAEAQQAGYRKAKNCP